MGGWTKRVVTDGRGERTRDGKLMGEAGSGSARAQRTALKQTSNYTAQGAHGRGNLPTQNCHVSLLLFPPESASMRHLTTSQCP